MPKAQTRNSKSVVFVFGDTLTMTEAEYKALAKEYSRMMKEGIDDHNRTLNLIKLRTYQLAHKKMVASNVYTFADEVIDMVDNIQRAMNGENQFEHLVLSDK